MSDDREFAIAVVRQLRDAGYQALWAGGCVRDMLLNKQPKDYDVATDARPEQVRAVFGRRKTIPVGISFGVIAVVDGHGQQIEVATFRQDAEYSDGRHPDSVRFSTAEEDAARRDFTINGMFYDPIDDQVIDFVGGQDDLRSGCIRAIGDPKARIDEDKLRMLRAVRFAVTLGFRIDPQTFVAVQAHAHELVIVSAERVAAELRRMMVHENRAVGLRLLAESELLSIVMPESDTTLQSDEQCMERTVRVLSELENPPFGIALAGLLQGALSEPHDPDRVEAVCKRWRLANSEIRLANSALRHEALLRSGNQRPWHEVQRVLILPEIRDLLRYAAAMAAVFGETEGAVDWCFRQLELPKAKLNPEPLLDGNQLRASGLLSPGPAYRILLEEVRNAQLEGQIRSPQEALELARSLAERLR